jgi:hypothetical protein
MRMQFVLTSILENPIDSLIDNIYVNIWLSHEYALISKVTNNTICKHVKHFW